jgi:hypothetical protein
MDALSGLIQSLEPPGRHNLAAAQPPEVAFNRAFTRLAGTGPGTFRRRAEGASCASRWFANRVMGVNPPR